MPALNLSDLRTESDHVRTKIAGYLNDLISLGVDGFRVDAAKHMNVNDVAAIKAKLTDPAVRGSRRSCRAEPGHLAMSTVREHRQPARVQLRRTT